MSGRANECKKERLRRRRMTPGLSSELSIDQSAAAFPPRSFPVPLTSSTSSTSTHWHILDSSQHNPPPSHFLKLQFLLKPEHI